MAAGGGCGASGSIAAAAASEALRDWQGRVDGAVSVRGVQRADVCILLTCSSWNNFVMFSPQTLLEEAAELEGSEMQG